MIRTFIDAEVLIAAARSASVGLDKAFDVFKDQNREFASSIFLKNQFIVQKAFKLFLCVQRRTNFLALCVLCSTILL